MKSHGATTEETVDGYPSLTSRMVELGAIVKSSKRLSLRDVTDKHSRI